MSDPSLAGLNALVTDRPGIVGSQFLHGLLRKDAVFDITIVVACADLETQF